MTDESPPSIPDEVLQQAMHLLAPVVRLLLAHGVDHPRLAAALKRVFVDEARADLARRGQNDTHTAVSLLTGLQRRDVRALVDEHAPPLPRKATAPTLPMQAVARWASEAQYLDEEGRPRALPMRSADADEPTFERLADEISKDVHAPALLEELLRLGLARVDERGRARLVSESFVPTGDFSQLLGALARGGHDHLAAAVSNVVEREQRFLDYSLFADELRPESAEALQALARRLWRSAYKRSVVAATELIERDKARGFTPDAPEMRVRFGVYFYSEPRHAEPTAPPPPRAPADDDGASR
ncbi:MAG: DUF6502 family protein [Burkholderiaceae bacterium]|nr:DUF6502 family protein [Burkholderiaceae bacterium]